MRTCLHCGRSIEHKRRDAKYCDRSCKAKASEQRRPPRSNQDRYRNERARRLAYARRKYAENAEAMREYSRQYRRNNPHRRRSADDRRALMMVENPGFCPFGEDEWERMKRRFDHCCAYCGEKSPVLEKDHVIPLTRGGRHALANILPACPACNRAKYNHLLSEWRAIKGGDSNSNPDAR